MVQAQPAQPLVPPATTRRRRTKEQIAADEAAKQTLVEAAEGSLNASEAGDVGTVVKTPATPTTVGPITADELRALLNGYIARHSMEDAIGQLKTFGCNRVTEALALEPTKLNALAEALRG